MVQELGMRWTEKMCLNPMWKKRYEKLEFVLGGEK